MKTLFNPSLPKLLCFILVMTFAFRLPLAAQTTGKLSQTDSLSGFATQATPEKVNQIFQKAGVVATFEVLDPKKAIRYTYNPKRAQQRFYPASTFKLLNTLIGFELNDISETEVFRYFGEKRDSPKWEKDMTLAEALQASNVPVFQTIAKRHGKEALRTWLQKTHYGNMQLGEDITRFWLHGPLAISAREQVNFLHHITHSRQAPFAEKNVRRLMAIMNTLHSKRSTLYYKTGWTGWNTGVTPHTAWVVGWVNDHSTNTLISFAFNMQPTTPDQLDQRLTLVHFALEKLGVM